VSGRRVEEAAGGARGWRREARAEARVCEASSALILLLDSLAQEHLRHAATATRELPRHISPISPYISARELPRHGFDVNG